MKQQRNRRFTVSCREIRLLATSPLSTRVARLKVDALAVGDWAVHPAVRPSIHDRTIKGGMAVTHAPSGLSLDTIAGDVSMSDALTIAATLAQCVPRTCITTKGVVQDDWMYIVMAIVGEILAG